jgi:hypothetical protein
MDHDQYMHYWSMNPDMDKETFDYVLESNVDASEEYHLYHTNNNEAC